MPSGTGFNAPLHPRGDHGKFTYSTGGKKTAGPTPQQRYQQQLKSMIAQEKAKQNAPKAPKAPKTWKGESAATKAANRAAYESAKAKFNANKAAARTAKLKSTAKQTKLLVVGKKTIRARNRVQVFGKGGDSKAIDTQLNTHQAIVKLTKVVPTVAAVRAQMQLKGL